MEDEKEKGWRRGRGKRNGKMKGEGDGEEGKGTRSKWNNEKMKRQKKRQLVMKTREYNEKNNETEYPLPIFEEIRQT